MFGQMPAERAAAIAAVVLLHLFLLWLLLRATAIHVIPPPAFRELPITLWLQTAPKPKRPELEPEETKKKNKGAPPVERAVGTPLPAPAGAPPASTYNGLRAFGRYLNNCSGGRYERLSARDWAHCLGNQWQNPGEGSLQLGIETPSIWKSEKDRQKAPAKPVERECDQGTINSNLGLPCYDFGN